MESNGSLLKTLQGHTAGIWGVDFNHNGQKIATASDDGTVKIWKPRWYINNYSYWAYTGS